MLPYTIIYPETRDIQIGNRAIGYRRPVYFIAEAGVNHNGDIKLALNLIKEAKKCGADAVKFQTFKAEQVCLPTSPTAQYQEKNTQKSNQWELLKPLELKEKDYPLLIKTAKKYKIDFLSTPHGHIESAKFLNRLNLPCFKVGSGDITNLPLLEFLAKTKKPIILSTGTANIKEIREAVQIVNKNKGKVIILHCHTDYPTQIKDANLGAIVDIMKNFPDKLIGYSDHTILEESLLSAVALGACVIEAHFTLDKNLPGPDQKTSFDPVQLKQAINKIRNLEQLMGSGRKIPTKKELQMAQMVRKSITTIKEIKKGEKFTEKNLSIRRPEKGGIKPKYWNKIIGKKSKRNIASDTQLKKGDWK